MDRAPTRAWAVLVALAPVVWAVTAAAQPARRAEADLQRFERRLEQIQQESRVRVDESIPVGQRLFVDYGAYLSTNYLSLDDSGGENRVLRQYELVGYSRFVLDAVHELFLRGSYEYRDFHAGDNFDLDDDDDDDETDEWQFERAVYRFDLQRYLGAYRRRAIDENVIVEAGRDFVYWANGLVLADTIDGARATIQWGGSDLVLLAGVTWPDAIDFDTSRPDFDDDTRRGFFGALWQTRLGRHRPFVYALAQQDYNDDVFVISSPPIPGSPGLDVTTEFDYDSYYIGGGVNGSFTDRLAYGVEVVYEGGRGLSNSFTTVNGVLQQQPQTHERIEAYAGAARVEYLPFDARRTRFSAEAIAATGDDDRLHTSNTFGGNAPGTTDRAFNAFGLVNTGVAFAPALSNLLSARVGAATFPAPDVAAFRRLQVGADLFVFAKSDADAPIDEPTTDERYLGWEPDVFLNWQITSDVTLAVRYGVFFPGDAIADAGGDDDPRHFIFTGLTIAF